MEPKKTRTISLSAARKLAVTNQHLSGGVRGTPTENDILSVLRDIIYVQIDPFSTVAPSHVLALWSRVQDFRLTELEDLLYGEKKVLEGWAMPASYILSEDYPLYYSLMVRYPGSLSDSWGAQRRRAVEWMAAHEDLARSIVAQLEGNELTLDQFEGHLKTRRREDGWTSGSDVAVMLSYLQMRGKVMVVRHEGVQRVWGLPIDFLPGWVDRTELPEPELERACAERAIHAMGTASAPEINYYFPRGMYQGLQGALQALEREGKIHRISIEDLGLREVRYVHERDLPLLEALESGPWKARTTLLAPFDNLMMGRSRTERLFGFEYVHGNYLPAPKRKYGLYVLPILRGERIIGRLDPRLDQVTRVLHINSVHAEQGAPEDEAVARDIHRAVERLARFVGAREVRYGTPVPKTWKKVLR